MKKAICGAKCAECAYAKDCKGCAETKGCPFGKQCFIAKYILTGGLENYELFKKGIISEVNALGIGGMQKVTELYPLVGSFINLEYPMPNGKTIKLLSDDEVYLGAQVENLFDDSGKSCYGIIARESFIIVCEYGENCVNPELVVFKRR